MAKKKVHVEVGRRQLDLSNLDKVLYPDDGIVKAEIIEYYLQLAPTILRHLRGRPLSLVRFPDGIYGEQFFQKNRPDWTPDWIDYIRLGNEKKKEYVVANEEATLVWLSNLACLEVHQMHCISKNTASPDYIVYDLDPPEDYNFQALKEIAFDLREYLERHNYHTFVKTTGGKGLHLVTPIDARYTFEEAFQAAKGLIGPYLDKNPNTTLHIKKESRKGRVLIDIYRNRPSQTIVSAYSLRGRKGATASVPVTWEYLKGVKNPSDLNLASALDLVLNEGDAWESIRAWSVPLHTDKRAIATKELPANKKHKTPEQLEEYEKKRDFGRTPEPDVVSDDGTGNRFVVQRHHASHLHYDLRLEQDGVLKSWAVPRGMPPHPGVKRLAVQTEDHPLKYLSFEGEIPKGEYGGGMMWVFASGKYEITKEKKDGFYFRLSGKTLNADYRMHLMKGKEWLLERVDNPQQDMLNKEVKPMLADTLKRVPSGDYLYEVKWDGIRTIITLNEGKLTIRSRNMNDITDQFPELNIPEEAFRINNAVFDGEIVCLDAQGKPDFKKVIKRLMTKRSVDAERFAARNPAHCYLFDCLYLDGRSLLTDPLLRRRDWLRDSMRFDTPYRMSEIVEDGRALFKAAKEHGIEGVMAKDPLGKYSPGKRSEAWKKVKVKETLDCHIIGYTKGEGEREKYFSSLQLAVLENDGLVYRGKVGTGFDDVLFKWLKDKLSNLPKVDKPVKEEAHDEKVSVWVDPQLKCEVEFSMITNNGTFRDPVFKKMVD
ncbi:MAG: non-homologous end-joining DNA ligase [Cyclobacteriaceae bacterium]|nr:non-homologous end-joining DNA ligase [Cyclobacteriaceae bacterium HetDA_MAG_MS6]